MFDSSATREQFAGVLDRLHAVMTRSKWNLKVRGALRVLRYVREVDFYMSHNGLYECDMPIGNNGSTGSTGNVSTDPN